MKLPDGTHLSYCTNVHAGVGWDETFAALRTHVPTVRRALMGATMGRTVRAATAQGFGIGLRLSHDSLAELEREARLAGFRQWLQEENCYVFTINGFPYGRFHAEPVKANVYRPDWTDPARLDYTCRLATLAAKLGAPEQRITISTLPGTYKAWAERAEPAIAAHLLACVVHCLGVKRETGVHVGIALEPEPCCLLETADEACAFFRDWLHTDAAGARVARAAGISIAAAATAIRSHLGMCHDVCHSAVEFEAPLAAFDRYAAAGIEVMKVQLSSALRLDPADAAARRALAAFDEPVYLHQVVARDSDGTLHRHSDIGAALAADLPEDSEWRVHFHVPVFLDALPGFDTTRDVLAACLEAHATRPLARHLEIETYTWDVLPTDLRDVPVTTAIAREIDWVGRRLEAAFSMNAGSMDAGTTHLPQAA